MTSKMQKPMMFTSGFATLSLAAVLLVHWPGTLHAEEKSPPGKLIQHGSMHVTIGERNHQARVTLAEVLKKPHFYGVGAVAGLHGEITILDSKATVTAVGNDGKPKAKPDAKAVKATMLIGQSVPEWIELSFEEDVSHEGVDGAIGKLAAANGVDTSHPFMFVLEGECTDVRLHVINGACPIRARMKKEPTPDEQKAFELETEAVKGTVVGVYAADSVGNLTHPATKQHSHLVYRDKSTGKQLNGHLEQYGVKKETVLKLPKIGQ